MTYTLYYSPDNANVIVRTVLEMLEQPYTDVLVDCPGALQKKSAEFRAMNPQGQLPVLLVTDQDEPLFETAAILLFLAERHGDLLPADVRQRGRALKWLFYLSNTLHADLRVLFNSPRYVADPVAIPTLRQALITRVTGHFALLDAEIAGSGGRWLLGGERCSVCDIYLAWCARWALIYPVGQALPRGALAAFPQLSAVLHRLQDDPAVLRACAREDIAAPAFTDPVLPQPTQGSVTG